MIEVQNLIKSFPTPSGTEKRAVDGLTFKVHTGQIYGLLGPNGAGKTTTLRILSGLMAPTDGTAKLDGFNVATHLDDVKKRIGFLTANTGLYQHLTPREVFRYFAELHGMRRDQSTMRCEELVEKLDMADFADLRCGSLSTGQKQRTNIGRALVADPPILILDEPTLGLDVLSNRTILNFIVSQRDAGKTILLSTHHLDEAEHMCDLIGLFHNGKLVAEGTLTELRTQTGLTKLTDIFLELVQEDRPLAVTE